METLSVAVNAGVVVAVGALLTLVTKGRFDQLSGDNARLRADMREQIGALRREMKAGDTSLRAEMKAGDTALRADIGDLRAEMRAEIGGLRAEIGAEIGGLRAELGIIRSDLTHVALAVGARTHPTNPEAQSG